MIFAIIKEKTDYKLLLKTALCHSKPLLEITYLPCILAAFALRWVICLGVNTGWLKIKVHGGSLQTKRL